MKVRVCFCGEIDAENILKGNKISGQALDTIYDLVWERELKNILDLHHLSWSEANGMAYNILLDLRVHFVLKRSNSLLRINFCLRRLIL